MNLLTKLRLAAAVGVIIVCSALSAADTSFFNGKDLTGWKGNEGYWSVKDGVIVGHSDQNIPRNEFLWSDVPVTDFYLAVDVKLTPGDRNAGIQFRSKPVDAHGQALGYQADIGHDEVIGNVWGNLYHEHGRGKLDFNDRAVKVVKKGDWNRYEILAVGHRIWTAVNGTLCTAIDDAHGELSGRIAFQIHGGPPQTVQYKVVAFTPDPKIELAGLDEKELIASLPEKELPYWSKRIMGVDPGSQGDAWTKPTFDHSQWKKMSLPGHFDTSAHLPGFDGVVWFRKTVELSAEQAASSATVHLGQIDDMDVSWVNGVRVGGYEVPGHHYTIRAYAVPEGILNPGSNTIAVRVMDHGAPGGIAGKPEMLFLKLGNERISLATDWHFASGANLATLKAYTPPEPSPLIRPLSRPATPVAAFAEGFTIEAGQTIVVLGSTNAFESGRQGYLETLLNAAWPEQRVRLRNMAWQADTVYLQQRPRNFFAAHKPNYGELDARDRTTADVIFFWMGQAESLDGIEALEDFKAAYESRLDELKRYTNRIVLVTPVPFSDPLSLGLPVEQRNQSLGQYVATIRDIAKNRSLPVVDQFAALSNRPDSLTTNGLHLTQRAHWTAATEFAKQLGFAQRLSLADAEVLPESLKSLRQAIQRKNEVWLRFWRPTNWAFLYGNRQTTASSRDHLNPAIRWFPAEVKSAMDSIQRAESEVAVQAKGLFDK